MVPRFLFVLNNVILFVDIWGCDYMNMININNFTKDYGNHKGVFNLSISIKKGEVYGFLGPNGAGKSTTMRHIMGFSKPDNGIITINNLDSWLNQKNVKEKVGYLAGEIALPDDMKGLDYLKLISKMRKMNSLDYMYELLDYFEIDPNYSIKKMSKGMKQKIAIVATFMHNPDIILLDEPTSGLDPLMQEKFIELVNKEKEKGKTIFMSSHIFEEIYKVCDRVGIIKEGNLIKEISIETLKYTEDKTFKVEFKNSKDLNRMKKLYPKATFINEEKQMQIDINDKYINKFIKDLSTCDLLFLKEKKHSLEEYFMKFYGGEDND